MPCYYPLQAFKSLSLSSTGKSEIFFDKPNNLPVVQIQLPCSRCIGCRLERSRQWAVRCMHEAQLYDDNCFITLTFNDDSLKSQCPDGSLNVRHFQLFMKRLRKEFGDGIRFYHCGEYGEKFGRPHYHACIFNFDFQDKYFWSMSNGIPLFRSATLERLWPFGHSSIGTVTFESAAYVARYIMKKHLGPGASLRYCDIDFNTGEILRQRKPEYTTMSRRPGIGKDWLDKYLQDVYPRGMVNMNGVDFKPPRFYDSQYEIQYPSDFKRLKQRRRKTAQLHSANSTPERLKVREQVQLARLKQLPRPLE